MSEHSVHIAFKFVNPEMNRECEPEMLRIPVKAPSGRLEVNL